MNDPSLLSFLFFLGIFLLVFLAGNKKRREPPPQRRHAPPKKKTVSQPVIHSSERPKREIKSSVYKVEKKKKSSFLQGNLKDKSSLKKAFIIAEILKRPGERDLF